MKKRAFYVLMVATFLFYSCEKEDYDGSISNPVPNEQIYFPPIDNNEWATTSPDSLMWDMSKMDELEDFLEEKNTKGFMILKDGKIVMEEYFNGHDVSKNWNWFSAAKSLTSTVVGIAVKEELLDIEEKTSAYLGENWTVAPKEKQDLIKVWNHITMTTGLYSNNTSVLEWSCTAPDCMVYDGDAGSQWAYHQGAFTQTQNILTKATGVDFKEYTREKLLDKIGMNGGWTDFFDVRVFASTTRSMARFGLLVLNEGLWNEAVVYPKDYHEAMISSSQDLNKAYGYLWWLNGKADFLVTADQTLYNGALIPNAPDDMYAALGLDDQKIYIVPSQNLIVIRNGESAGGTEFTTSSFDNDLWGLITQVIP